MSRFHRAYLLGSISYEALDQIGIPFLKGEKDWRNGTTFWTDCLNVEVWQLNSINETLKIFKGEYVDFSDLPQVSLKTLGEVKRRISKGLYKQWKLPKA